MNHTALPENNDGPTLEPQQRIGLGWQEFFQQLGRTAMVQNPRVPLAELIQE